MTTAPVLNKNEQPQSQESNLDENGPSAHFPPYKVPTHGLVSYLPPTLIPYAELMRLHTPAGFYGVYLQYLFGVLIAASLTSPTPSISTLLYLSTVHAVACVFLRGAGCTRNDAVDAPLDRQVARCRNRPVARGA
ncbi:MAG: hypothetical protein Q9190_000399, partial [Brigantiaea leucoxantha]